jgi:hypothetical protein
LREELVGIVGDTLKLEEGIALSARSLGWLGHGASFPLEGVGSGRGVALFIFDKL